MPDIKQLRNMSDAEALIRVSSDYKRYKSAKFEDIARNKEYDNIYQALDPDALAIDESTGTLEDDEGSQSNTYLPVGAAVVDSGVTQLWNLFFSRPDYMKMGFTDWRDHFQTDKITAHMITRHNEMKFKTKMRRIFLQAGCFDYCVSVAKWKLEPGYVPERVEEETFKQMGKLKVPFRRVKTEMKWRPDAIDRPDMFVIPYNLCYHDPTARIGFEDSEAFFDDRQMLLEDLYQNEKTADRPYGKYNNIGILEANAIDNNYISGPNAYTEASVDDWEDQKIGETSRKVWVHRCWTEDHIVEWSHGTIIRRMNVSGWPLQLWKIFYTNNNFRGMGLLERMERQLLDINASLNARRNYQNLVSDPFGLVHEDLIAEAGGSMRMQSGTLLPTSGEDIGKKIWVFQPSQDLNQNAMADIDAEIQMINKTTPLSNENTSGAYTSGRRSAAQTNSVEQAVFTSAQVIAMSMESEALEPFYMEQFKLEAMNMTEPKKFQYFGKYGKEFLHVNPADYAFHAQPMFKAIGAVSQAMNALRNQQFLLMMDKSIQAPQLHNMPEIFTEAWRRFVPDGYENFVKDPTIPDHNVPAQMENELFANGRYVEVSPSNNHQNHIQGHQAITRTADYQLWPQSYKSRMEQHISEHVAAQTQAVTGGQPQQTGQIQDPSDGARGLRLNGVQ